MHWEIVWMRYIVIFTHIHTHCYHLSKIMFSYHFLPFQLGYELDDGQLSNLFWRFKSVAEQKKVVRASAGTSLGAVPEFSNICRPFIWWCWKDRMSFAILNIFSVVEGLHSFSWLSLLLGDPESYWCWLNSFSIWWGVSARGRLDTPGHAGENWSWELFSLFSCYIFFFSQFLFWLWNCGVCR